jgi:hypothetical protein
MNQELHSSIETAKRCCSRCNSHKTFNPNEEDQELAQKACKRAHSTLNEVFDEMRRKDETTLEQINLLKKAKSICLDAYDACKTCDKDQPLIRQMLGDIKSK